MRTSLLKGLLAGTLLMLVAAPAAGAAVTYGACSDTTSFTCANITVPLDRSGVVPGAVKIFARRKVAPANPTRTAVVSIVGGPGQAAIPFAGEFADLLAPALTTRDLLVFDQRGTGLSGTLRCDTKGATSVAEGRNCATSLGPKRAFYTTANSVDDLEALRAESGYERLLLYGVSYGTKLALDYAARFPGRVEGLVLDSTVPTDGGDQLYRQSFQAMPRVLSQLCAARACKGITAAPTRDLRLLIKRLSRGRLRGRLFNAGGGSEAATVERSDMFNLLIEGDLYATLRAELPGSIVAARRGDTAPLIRLTARASGTALGGAQTEGEDFSDALFNATTCEESIFPWTRGASAAQRLLELRSVVAALGPAQFLPFDQATVLDEDFLGLCRGWPNAAPAPTPSTTLPNLPTLILSGSEDLRTPLEDAQRVRALIPAAQLLSVPATGHDVLGRDATPERCVARALGEFLASRPVTACAPLASPYAPTPAPPRHLSSLKGTGGKGKVARTVTAALRTLADARRQVVGALENESLPIRTGGLRGGSLFASSSERLSLRGTVYVRGVAIFGTAPLEHKRGTARLRIRGSSAANGYLTISTRGIKGRLGGRRVNLPARAASAAAHGFPRVRAVQRSYRLRPAR